MHDAAERHGGGHVAAAKQPFAACETRDPEPQGEYNADCGQPARRASRGVKDRIAWRLLGEHQGVMQPKAASAKEQRAAMLTAVQQYIADVRPVFGERTA
jgi:hypothetical protein